MKKRVILNLEEEVLNELEKQAKAQWLSRKKFMEVALINRATDGVVSKIQKLIEKHKPEFIITGGALGIDTLAALIAIHNGITLVVAIPCKNQEKIWPQKSKDLYLQILNHPNTRPYYVSKEEFTPWCMSKRNEWMVDQLDEHDLLIAVWDGSSGGTENCIEYARKQGKWNNVIHINPKLL